MIVTVQDSLGKTVWNSWTPIEDNAQTGYLTDRIHWEILAAIMRALVFDYVSRKGSSWGILRHFEGETYRSCWVDKAERRNINSS